MQIRHDNIFVTKNHLRSDSFILIVLLFLAGCDVMQGSMNHATATAQAQRAMEMATRAGDRLRQTQTAERQHALATAQAAETILLAALDWPLLLEDSFNSNDNGWAIQSEEDPELASIEWKIENGKYRWEAQAISPFVWWVTPTQYNVGDFYLAVTGKQLEGPSDGEYGLVFRMNEDGEYYVFEVSEMGYYGLFLYSDGTWTALIDWTDTALIQDGAENRLEVTASNGMFYLGVNGQRLTEYANSQLPTGQVGLLIGLYDIGDRGIWEFDDFEFRSPDASPVTTSAP